MEWHIHPPRWGTVAYIKLYYIIFLCIFDVKNVPRKSLLCAHVMQKTIIPPLTVPLKNFKLWVQSMVLLLSEVHEELIITKAGRGNVGWGSVAPPDVAVEARLLTWNCSGKGEHGSRGRFANGNTRVCNLPLLTQLTYDWCILVIRKRAARVDLVCMSNAFQKRKTTRTHYHSKNCESGEWANKVCFTSICYFSAITSMATTIWYDIETGELFLAFWSPKLCLMALVNSGKSL